MVSLHDTMPPIDYVDERDLIEVLQELIDDRDAYADIAKRFSSSSEISVSGLRFPVGFTLLDAALEINNIDGCVLAEMAITQVNSHQTMTSFSLDSLDGEPIVVRKKDNEMYEFVRPYGKTTLMSRSRFDALFTEGHFKKNKKIDFASLQSNSLESDTVDAFTIVDEGATIECSYQEIETPTDSLFSFEVMIMRSHQSSRRVGTKFVIVESLSQAMSSISVDKIEPSSTVRIIIESGDAVDGLATDDELEFFHNDRRVLTPRRVTKTQLADIIDALDAIKRHIAA